MSDLTPPALTKVCRTCEIEKPADDFYHNRRVCKLCKSVVHRTWAQENPEAHRTRTREWQRRNPEKVLDMKLKRQYGITLVEFRVLLEKQSGKCAICGEACATGQRLAVDHCHTTGRVRALLCRACNSALGLMGEDPKRLLSAVDYLRQHAEDR